MAQAKDHPAAVAAVSPDDLTAVSPLPREAGAFALTDTGNAERLVAQHGNDLRYCSAWQSWFVWNGTRWERDDGLRVAHRAKQAVRSIAQEAWYEEDPDLRTRILRWAAASESEVRRRAMVTLARSEPGIAVPADHFDTDPLLLSVTNGVLDLRTGQLLPARRRQLVSNAAPVAFDPAAECPRWLAFLQRIMDGNADLIAFLQRAVGYSLTGQTSEQCLFLLHGTGANGKSVLLRTLQALLGDYARTAAFETFLSRSHDGPRNDIAALRSARLVCASEVEQGRHLAESLIKTLTGGDAITVRFLYAEEFSYVPRFKVWLAANYRPVIRGTDLAIWRRIRLIPFRVTIPESEQDRDLPEKLRTELPGLLNWALEGCLAWQRDGLQAPPDIVQATSEYRTESDPVADFLTECCAEDPEARIAFADLYAAYKSWVAADHEEPLSAKAFAHAVSGKGYDSARTKEGRFRVGLRLVE